MLRAVNWFIFLALQFPLMFSVCSINLNQLWNRTIDVMMYYWWVTHEWPPYTHSSTCHWKKKLLFVLLQCSVCCQLWSRSRLCASRCWESARIPERGTLFSCNLLILSPTMHYYSARRWRGSPCLHCSSCHFREWEISFAAVFSHQNGGDGVED